MSEYSFEKFEGKRKRQTYDHEEFVRHYMHTYHNGLTMDDLAESLNLDRQVAQGRLASLRSKGVKLPNLKRATWGNPIDVDKLNQIVARPPQPKSKSKERTDNSEA